MWLCILMYIFWINRNIKNAQTFTSRIVRWMFCLCAWLLFLWTWFAQIDNTNNPFTDPKNSWSAEKIWVVWLAEAWTDNWGQEDSLVNVIKWVVNRALWILALIALLVVLRWGFQMVIAAWNEDQYGKWFTILKQAAAWLALIWVAWFIVSWIFWLINLVTENAWEDWWTAW